MKEKNDYGFYSGGYIFDRLDRAALRFVRQAYPELKGKQVYTSWSEIKFHKQLCALNNSKVYLDCCETFVGMSGATVYEVNVYLTVPGHRIASATFWFKEAKHNYCETQGENK